MGPENEECVSDTAVEKLDELQDELSEDEALSLCDLPINHNACHEFSEPSHNNYSSVLSLRPQLPADDFFEFFASNSDMCPADDIIVSGKLLPLKDNQCRLPKQTGESSATDGLTTQNTRCRRSESQSELKSTAQYNSTKARAVRTSRSLDDKRHRRCSHSSFESDKLDRNGSASSSKPPKSRWQLLISGIGIVKFPPEMELRDIKNRQSRRTNPTNLQLSGSEAKSPAASGSNNGSSWGLIKALSCKDHTSISVTTSFVCMPHI